MITRLATLILTMYLIQTAEFHHWSYLTVVEVGDNVTLQCPLSKHAKFVQWYKISLEYVVQTVATGTFNQQTLHPPFNNTRFKVIEKAAHCILAIGNISREDEATYFCQTGGAYSQSSGIAVLLAVNDRTQQKSVNVTQNPETASVQPGDSVTLRCSLLSKNKENRAQCPGEHNVYWFRSGSGKSHPSIIYTHRNRSDEQKERSCDYSLSKTIRDSSDTGTYYCAVVTCGQILFGEGTQVNTGSELYTVVLVLGVLLACCLIVITVLICYLNRRRVCEHCKAGAKSASHNPGHEMSMVDQSTNLDGDAEAVNYAALDFSTIKMKRVKKKRESPQECVYSAVRADHHTQHHL